MRHIVRGSLTKVVATLVVLTMVVGTLATHQTRALASHAATTNSMVLKDVGPFEATVYQGPDKGLSLMGELKLRTVVSGQLTGMLVLKNGKTVPITGQVTGLAISMVFYLGGGKHIFGAGTFGVDPGAKHGFLGGVLAGPNGGDSGDWGSVAYGIGYVLGVAVKLCISFCELLL